MIDNAVALVRAYLHLNGYFTVTEFPVVEALGEGAYRTATDLDVLAFRFLLTLEKAQRGTMTSDSPASTMRAVWP